MKKDDIDFLIRALELVDNSRDNYEEAMLALRSIYAKMGDADSVLLSIKWVELLVFALHNQAVRHVGCQVPDGVEVIKKCALLIAALKQLQDLAAESV